jgi:RNA polymerase sigma factor (sigma-70 family)
LARQLARSSAEADDLVSEAFAKVLDALRAGRGPDTAFRAYLLTSLRHTAYDKTRKDKRVQLSDDVTTIAAPEQISVPFQDTAVAGLEKSLAARAFARLPERWQAVLWHTEIEGQSAAEVAPLLGITANGVSALAYRAREGLRQAYLQVHLAETKEEQCRTCVDRLGSWTRGGLSKRETAQVEMHLDECVRCRALAAELADVNGAMRAIIAPMVLGAGAVGYLATAGTVTTLAAGAGAAAGGAGAAGAALPRQLIGVGASTAALAAAIVIGLVANTSAPIIPAADAPVTASTPNVPAPAVTPKPSPNPSPKPPVVAPKPAVKPPASVVPSPSPTPTPTTASVAKTAKLSAVGPSSSISLVPGGNAVAVPITITNNGNGNSGPVTAALNLPKGVRAVSSNAASQPSSTDSAAAQPSAYRVQSAAMPEKSAMGDRMAAASTSRTVQCPAGSGTVSCTDGTGVAPGQSVTLMFLLKADTNAVGGTVTGTVSSQGIGATATTLSISVPVVIQQVDKLALTAQQYSAELLLAQVAITVTNTGTTSGKVTVDLDRWGTLLQQPSNVTCSQIVNAVLSNSLRCQTTNDLAPGESVTLKAYIPSITLNTLTDLTVTATLGTDVETKHVQICLLSVPLVTPGPK